MQDVSDLLQLLSLCISLRVLNLSGTGINIDKLWASLIYGGLQLEILKFVSLFYAICNNIIFQAVSQMNQQMCTFCYCGHFF